MVRTRQRKEGKLTLGRAAALAAGVLLMVSGVTLSLTLILLPVGMVLLIAGLVTFLSGGLPSHVGPEPRWYPGPPVRGRFSFLMAGRRFYWNGDPSWN